MEKKYLNEETYRKGKKGLIIASIVVFVIGLLIGGTLIFTGINKANEVTINEPSVNKEELEQRKKEINEELIPYKAQKNEEFRNNGFSEEYYRFEAKIDELQDELYDIESELNKIDMGFYDASSDMDKMKSVPYYMFGGFIIFVSIMIGGSLLITAYRRNIMAFTAQQAIPIVKEGVDELAPVVGSAAGKIAEAASPHIKKATKEMAPVFGDIAKEISKGIKEGTKK